MAHTEGGPRSSIFARPGALSLQEQQDQTAEQFETLDLELKLNTSNPVSILTGHLLPEYFTLKNVHSFVWMREGGPT